MSDYTPSLFDLPNAPSGHIDLTLDPVNISLYQAKHLILNRQLLFHYHTYILQLRHRLPQLHNIFVLLLHDGLLDLQHGDTSANAGTKAICGHEDVDITQAAAE